MAPSVLHTLWVGKQTCASQLTSAKEWTRNIVITLLNLKPLNLHLVHLHCRAKLTIYLFSFIFCIQTTEQAWEMWLVDTVKPDEQQLLCCYTEIVDKVTIFERSSDVFQMNVNWWAILTIKWKNQRDGVTELWPLNFTTIQSQTVSEQACVLHFGKSLITQIGGML